MILFTVAVLVDVIICIKGHDRSTWGAQWYEMY